MALPRFIKKSLPSLMQERRDAQTTLLKSAGEIRDRDERRELRQDEINLLAFVLANGDQAAQSFQHQLACARVMSRCGCGCPTIGLEVDRTVTPGSAVGRIIVDVLGKTPDGGQVGVLVFVEKGFLSGLEVYELDPHDKPYPLPTLDSLHPFESALER